MSAAAPKSPISRPGFVCGLTKVRIAVPVRSEGSVGIYYADLAAF